MINFFNSPTDPYLPFHLLLGVALLVLLGFLIREVVCWYWKINKMVDLLNSVDQHLNRLVEGMIAAQGQIPEDQKEASASASNQPRT